jgi:ribonuclease P protein component
MGEEDVPAEQPEAEQEARLPDPHADARRARGDPSPPRQGPRPPVRLIWRVRDRATLRALAAGRRHRRGALAVTVVPTVAGDPPRVAYAVGRGVGGAVRRNRVRRRLRAAVAAEAAALQPGHAYLVSATTTAADHTWRELRDTLRAILSDAEPAR